MKRFLFVMLSMSCLQVVGAIGPETLPHIEQDVNANSNSSSSYSSSLSDGQFSRPRKLGAPEEVQALIDYAWEKTQSIDFILTVERESGRRWDAVGDNGSAYGLCQWNPHNQGKDRWVGHYDPTIADGYVMIDTCRKTWQLKGKNVGSWLHAYKARHTVRDRFTFN